MLHSLAEKVDPSKDERPATEGEPITFADLWIRTKERDLVPLVPNAVQSSFLDVVCPAWRVTNLPGALNGQRENILKARQFGFSTIILAMLFLDTLARKNTYSVVVAHDAESTERLFQTVKTFYDHLPEHKQPRTKYANRREYVWPDLNSSFFVGQAGSRDFGRSSTINNLLATEVAFWPDPARLFPALLGAVPDSGNAFMESTANGFGTWHEEEYKRSKEKKSTFRAWFFAWFRHPEYRAPVAPNFDEETQNLDNEEREKEEFLVSRYGLTREQLQWRRNKLREPGMLDKFAQENPANDEEAFINSGRSAFRGSWVLKQVRNEVPAINTSELPESIREAFGTELENLHVFALPVVGRRYVIGGDVSEGLAHRDFSALVVLDKETLEEVATYHGRPEPDVLGVYADVLGRWYNNGRNGIERNNHGFTTLTKMRDLGTPNVFLYDDERRGWLTNDKTKPQIIDRLGVALRDDLIKVRYAAARDEMRAYNVLPSGAFGAPRGKYDDLVMAWAIALEMARRWTVVDTSTLKKNKTRNRRY